MTLAFPCENCGHRFEVDGSLAGKKCKCKKCGHIFLIPVPRPVEPSPVRASRERPPSGPGSTRPAKSRPAAPDPYYDDGDPYAADDRFRRVASQATRHEDFGVGVPGQEPVLVRTGNRGGGGGGPAASPIKTPRKRWGYKGEPFGLGLRWAAVIFTAIGIAGLIVAVIGGAFLAAGDHARGHPGQAASR